MTGLKENHQDFKGIFREFIAFKGFSRDVRIFSGIFRDLKGI